MWLNQRCHVACNVAMQQVLSLTQCPFSSYRKPATSLTESIKSCSLEMWKSCSLLEHLGGIIGKSHYGIKWVGPAIITIPASVFSLGCHFKFSTCQIPKNWFITAIQKWSVTFLMGDRSYCYDTVNWIWVSEGGLKAFSIEILQNKENAVPPTGKNPSKDLRVVTVVLT